MSFSLSADSVASLSLPPSSWRWWWELGLVGAMGSGSKGCWWTPMEDAGSGEKMSVWPWCWPVFTQRPVVSEDRSKSMRLSTAMPSMMEITPLLLALQHCFSDGLFGALQKHGGGHGCGR